jgi:hypothetical protein
MNGVTEKHRCFIVNGKLEFALFFDPAITDKNIIIKTFFDSKDWKWHLDYFKVKVIKTEVSPDLKEVYITVEDKK